MLQLIYTQQRGRTVTDDDLVNVSRIQLQTELGRYEFWADRWEFVVQDDGHTLHLRGRGEGTYAKVANKEAQ